MDPATISQTSSDEELLSGWDVIENGVEAKEQFGPQESSDEEDSIEIIGRESLEPSSSTSSDDESESLIVKKKVVVATWPVCPCSELASTPPATCTTVEVKAINAVDTCYEIIPTFAHFICVCAIVLTIGIAVQFVGGFIDEVFLKKNNPVVVQPYEDATVDVYKSKVSSQSSILHERYTVDEHIAKLLTSITKKKNLADEFLGDVKHLLECLQPSGNGNYILDVTYLRDKVLNNRIIKNMHNIINNLYHDSIDIDTGLEIDVDRFVNSVTHSIDIYSSEIQKIHYNIIDQTFTELKKKVTPMSEENSNLNVDVAFKQDCDNFGKEHTSYCIKSRVSPNIVSPMYDIKMAISDEDFPPISKNKKGDFSIDDTSSIVTLLDNSPKKVKNIMENDGIHRFENVEVKNEDMAGKCGESDEKQCTAIEDTPLHYLTTYLVRNIRYYRYKFFSGIFDLLISVKDYIGIGKLNPRLQERLIEVERNSEIGQTDTKDMEIVSYPNNDELDNDVEIEEIEINSYYDDETVNNEYTKNENFKKTHENDKGANVKDTNNIKKHEVNVKDGKNKLGIKNENNISNKKVINKQKGSKLEEIGMNSYNVEAGVFGKQRKQLEKETLKETDKIDNGKSENNKGKLTPNLQDVNVENRDTNNFGTIDDVMSKTERYKNNVKQHDERESVDDVSDNTPVMGNESPLWENLRDYTNQYKLLINDQVHLATQYSNLLSEDVLEKMKHVNKRYKSVFNSWLSEMDKVGQKMRKKYDNAISGEWFFKMNEEREKLRNEPKEDSASWFFNLGKAREEMRSKMRKPKTGKWYFKMSKNRSKARKHNKKAWYRKGVIKNIYDAANSFGNLFNL